MAPGGQVTYRFGGWQKQYLLRFGRELDDPPMNAWSWPDLMLADR
jgi:hypothetical protein